MSTESKWIPVTQEKPSTCSHKAVLAVVYGEIRVYHLFAGDCALPGMTHWQPLPSLPPKPDAFEEFWNSEANSQGVMVFRGEIVTKQAARFFWDNGVAAVNAGKVV